MKLIASAFALATLASIACTTNVAAVAAAGATPGGKTNGEATTKAAATLKTLAVTTPPAGATLKGTETKPKVGNVEVPIVNVEVYVASINIDSDPGAEEVFWAVSGDSVYVWAAATVPCSDGVGSGEEYLVYASEGAKYGWLVGGDGCGWTDSYGCSGAAGASEVCGGCAWSSAAIVCETVVSK